MVKREPHVGTAIRVVKDNLRFHHGNRRNPFPLSSHDGVAQQALREGLTGLRIKKQGGGDELSQVVLHMEGAKALRGREEVHGSRFRLVVHGH